MNIQTDRQVRKKNHNNVHDDDDDDDGAHHTIIIIITMKETKNHIGVVSLYINVDDEKKEEKKGR